MQLDVIDDETDRALFEFWDSFMKTLKDMVSCLNYVFDIYKELFFYVAELERGTKKGYASSLSEVVLLLR